MNSNNRQWVHNDGHVMQLHGGTASNGRKFGYKLNYCPGSVPVVEVFVSYEDPEERPVVTAFRIDPATDIAEIVGVLAGKRVGLPIGALDCKVEDDAIRAGRVLVTHRWQGEVLATMVPVTMWPGQC